MFTVGVHVIPWHLRWGQALSEGVHVIVLLLQAGESHLLLLLLLRLGVWGAQALHLRGQSTTRGRCGVRENNCCINWHLWLSNTSQSHCYSWTCNIYNLIWPDNEYLEIYNTKYSNGKYVILFVSYIVRGKCASIFIWMICCIIIFIMDVGCSSLTEL